MCSVQCWRDKVMAMVLGSEAFDMDPHSVNLSQLYCLGERLDGAGARWCIWLNVGAFQTEVYNVVQADATESLSAVQWMLERQPRDRSWGPHEQNVNEGGLFKEIQDRCLSWWCASRDRAHRGCLWGWNVESFSCLTRHLPVVLAHKHREVTFLWQ